MEDNVHWHFLTYTPERHLPEWNHLNIQTVQVVAKHVHYCLRHPDQPPLAHCGFGPRRCVHWRAEVVHSPGDGVALDAHGAVVYADTHARSVPQRDGPVRGVYPLTELIALHFTGPFLLGQTGLCLHREVNSIIGGPEYEHKGVPNGLHLIPLLFIGDTADALVVEAQGLVHALRESLPQHRARLNVSETHRHFALLPRQPRRGNGALDGIHIDSRQQSSRQEFPVLPQHAHRVQQLVAEGAHLSHLKQCRCLPHSKGLLDLLDGHCVKVHERVRHCLDGHGYFKYLRREDDTVEYEDGKYEGDEVDEGAQDSVLDAAGFPHPKQVDAPNFVIFFATEDPLSLQPELDVGEVRLDESVRNGAVQAQGGEAHAFVDIGKCRFTVVV
eukprot:Hpha_TRINITY_DN8425_c0_g1::TRINITY_DN8425_c0_g1_i1::g.34843::m.34843